jgi:pimeloyl-ACP methyl ester carboxylesterase
VRVLRRSRRMRERDGFFQLVPHAATMPGRAERTRKRFHHVKHHWAAVLANFEPGHQDGYVNYGNDQRAPLLLIAGGEDHLQPAAVNESNFKHYRNSNAVTDYHEFAGRSHYTVGEDGWEEVADYALEWAEEKATQPAA